MIRILLNQTDKFFDKITRIPPMILICAIMTLFVLNVPFEFLLFQERLHTNKPLASTFFKDWFWGNNFLLMVHIACAIPAIIIGPILFEPRLRKSKPHIHRFCGKIYIFACLISALTVVPLALNHGVKPIGQIGFTSMAIVWSITTWCAFTAARCKDFIAHRRWIMRSYAMTFAFVHVNLTFFYLAPYEFIGPKSGTALQSCVSWQMNLLFVEIYLALTTFKGRFAGWKTFLHNLTHWNGADKFYLRLRSPVQSRMA